MIINAKKCSYMVFKSRQKRQPLDLIIKINIQQISQVIRTALFLGVVHNENMSWKLHISHISCKISKSIGLIYKSCSFCLTRARTALRTLYFSLIYPYLHYCVPVRGSTYPTNL
jgi:hypothetical protein